MNATGLALDGLDLASPFSCATVVVADDYVDTFPHPQYLITYLQRLCVQLDIDIVSLERPVTFKGSWRTIIKIDAFLKTLISTLHSAISKDTVPSEEDFNTAFSHFEKGNNYQTELLERQSKLQNSGSQDNGLELFKSHDSQYFEVTKIDYDDDIGQAAYGKWYFNANPRGKTVDRRNKRCTLSGKAPPEPYVIVEGDESNTINQSNFTEIEKVLYQVYKKETIEKYQKKSISHDVLAHDKNAAEELEAADIVKEEIVSDASNEEQRCITEAETLTIGINEKKKEKFSVIETKELLKNFGSNNIKGFNQRKNAVDHQDKQSIRGKSSKAEKLTTENEQPAERRRSTRQKKPHRSRIYYEDINELVSGKKSIKEKTSQNKCTSHVNVNKDKRLMADHRKNTSEEIDLKNKKAKIIDTLEVSDNNEPKHENNASKLKVKGKVGEQSQQGKNFECDQCSYVTSKEVQLKAHKRRIHLTESFRCIECDKEFGFQKDLRRHMKCHTKAENCCDVCGKMYKEERKLLEHKRIHSEDYVKPQYPCKFCSKSFSTKYVLAYHIKSEHLGMKRSYICPTCGKSFSQRNSYIQHANVHLGIKPFTCEVCGKRFSYEKSLKEHKFMHNEDKVFSCPVCKKSFRQASGLGIHMKVHKATKDYVCSMCGKGFSQKQALERHERIHAGEKPYECGLCKRSFADSSVLRRHMILIHKKDPKEWRQDTLFHIPKKTDFFISVIESEGVNSRSLEPQYSDNTRSQNQDLSRQQQEYFDIHQQLNLNHKPRYLKQQHKVFQQPDNPRQQEGHHYPQHTEHIQQTQFNENECALTVTVTSGPPNSVSLVKEESPSMSHKEAPAILVGGFNDTSTSFVDVKPYVSFVPDRSFEVMDSALATSGSSLAEPSVFSSPTSIQPAPSLQIHNSISLPSHCVESVTEQHPLSLATQMASPLTSTPNTASLLPITYQQRSFNYDTGGIQPLDLQQVQYSAMIQQYPQAIVVLQDNLATLTYHQPTVSISFADDSVSQNVQLHHINQGSVTLSSSPLSHLLDHSQTITSVSSNYDSTLPSSHP